MTIRNLDTLFNPSSITLIGASPRSGSVGYWTAQNLTSAGFAGDVHFVNPRHLEVDGKPCFKSIAELPSTPDLGVIATPAATVPGIISELGEKGARAAVCITGGLSAEAKQHMLDAAKPYCLRILGPNCIGLQVPGIGLNASFAHRHAPVGDIAFLSQSGALVTAVIDWAAERGIGFSHVISNGDMTDVDFGDILDYLAGDTSSRAILIYIEALTNAAKFMSAVRRASRAKPVILVKSGRTEMAAMAAMSHTGALAGADDVYNAAFKRSGVLRVDDLEQLFEAAEILRVAPRLNGERLAILTNGGGAGVLAADRLAELGGTPAVLSEATRASLNAVLPSTWSGSNPIDIIGDADAARYRRALRTVVDSEDCDAVLAIYCPTALASGTEIAQSVVELASGPDTLKPVLTNWLGDPAAREPRDMFTRNDIPTFETPGSAVRGFMHLVHHRRARRELMRTSPALPAAQEADRQSAATVIDKALQAGRTILTADEAKTVLSAYGIPIVEAKFVSDISQIELAAESLLKSHTSVALKIRSGDISHKSDAGGVVLALKSAVAVETAARDMLSRIAVSHPNAEISGFSLEPMIETANGIELLIGMSVDRTFGPTITFGAGGVSVEVVKDTAISLLPVDARLARDLVEQTDVARLLHGYRNRPAADFTAIYETLVAVSTLAIEYPAIRELDINPLVVNEAGAIVLDARIRIADPVKEPRQALSVRPYPKQWERDCKLAQFSNVRIRPIVPQDELLYARFGELMTPQDVRLRLFTTPTTLSHEFVARMTQIDYAREMAFVAIDETSGELLGIARLIADPDYRRAEYAIITRSDVHGKGLGWQLMQHLIDYAKAEGLAELFGSVLSVNKMMLKMCRELGFDIDPVPGDATLRHVRLKLDR
ncbi:MAG: bifunctional acetate--CoA ligase family protein/GNAT family N-acetyltransferase [Hyphomicrobiaceae bacterium]